MHQQPIKIDNSSVKVYESKNKKQGNSYNKQERKDHNIFLQIQIQTKTSKTKNMKENPIKLNVV